MKDYHTLLLQYDEVGAYEYPSGFDYDQLETAARSVDTTLHSKLGLKTRFEGGEYNQDASFSIEIYFVDFEKKEERFIYCPTLRFSNFGRLVTLPSPALLSAERNQQIEDLTEALGFIFIPADQLEKKYDGHMAGKPGFDTWWLRYFDYL